jgi:hypothetical protein
MNNDAMGDFPPLGRRIFPGGALDWAGALSFNLTASISTFWIGLKSECLTSPLNYTASSEHDIG